MGQYTIYPNKYPGRYTVHIDFSAESDKQATNIAQEIFYAAQLIKGAAVSIHFVTDSDDWAEFVHHDDHPNAVRTGCGRRIVIDEHGNIVP